MLSMMDKEALRIGRVRGRFSRRRPNIRRTLFWLASVDGGPKKKMMTKIAITEMDQGRAAEPRKRLSQVNAVFSFQEEDHLLGFPAPLPASVGSLIFLSERTHNGDGHKRWRQPSA
jgi:hypothetical protein